MAMAGNAAASRSNDTTAAGNVVELTLIVPTAPLHSGLYQLHIEGRRADHFESVSRETLQIPFVEP